MKILFITTRDPFAERFSGDVMRSSRIIKLLRKKYSVDLLFIGKKEVQNNKRNITLSFKNLNFLYKIYYCLISFFKCEPVQFGLFYSPELKNYVKRNAYKYDILFFHQIRSVQYLPKNYKGKTILEMGDLYSKNYSQTYKNLSVLNPLTYCYLIESFLIKKIENKSFNLFKNIILFSKKEINLVEKDFKKKIIHIPESIHKIKKIYNFSKNNYKILFIGNLKYLPNKLACMDFTRRVLPRISSKFPEIEFHIIGDISRFNKFLLSFYSKVKVIGQQKNLEKYMQKTICGLANLKIATGVQGKVLTYMSYGFPTICSKKVSENFDLSTISYKSEKELISQISDLKQIKYKSELYSKKSQNYIKKFLWKNISIKYLKLIKNSF